MEKGRKKLLKQVPTRKLVASIKRKLKNQLREIKAKAKPKGCCPWRN